MTEFNVLGALALASIAGFAATQSTNRPVTIRAAAQPADGFDRSTRAGTGLERAEQKAIK